MPNLDRFALAASLEGIMSSLPSSMRDLIVSVPDDRLTVLNVPPEEAGAEVQMLAAVKLYELGRLSSGAAAEFAGVPKPVFLERLGSYGVATFRQTEQELLEEVRNA
jgi:hypothetical protein